MTSPAVTIAKEIHKQLKPLDYGQTARVERSYAEWDIELKKLDAAGLPDSDAGVLRIDAAIVSTEQAMELATRTSMKLDVPIDIAVRKKFRETESETPTGRLQVEEIDKLMAIVAMIGLKFAPTRLPELTSPELEFTWESTRILVAPWREHLRQLRQFTGLIRLMFRADVKLITTEGADG